VSAQVRLGFTDEEVTRVLAFLNDCDTTFDVLDVLVGLDSDAADNLVEHRDAADQTCGTADDRPFATLDEVDDVPQVGDRTIEDIRSYVLAGADGTGEWDGVEFTAAEQAVVLDIANHATVGELDEDVGLASDAAQNIVDARPIDSMGALAAVPQVGEAALQRLKDYIPVWSG
jgi:DNA uptake protein ComE-like DNA-binding protein